MKRNIVYLLSGIQCSGKDTFLRENQLDMYSISMDEIRKLYNQPTMNEHGHFVNNNDNNAFIFYKLKEILVHKMMFGGPIIINAMNIKADGILEYKNIVSKYGYDIEVVDFGLKELDFYLERNKNRPEFDRLNEMYIKNSYETKEKLVYPENIKVYQTDEFIKEIKKSAKELAFDANQYKNIHFIGDLQGCAQTLFSFLKEKTAFGQDLYVFVGDYIDRGEENSAILKFIDKMKDHDNFIFLKGNHDENLYKYAISENIEEANCSHVFIEKTLPELLNNGFTKEKMLEIYNNLEDFKFIQYGDKLIFANHAGLKNIPKYPLLMSKSLLINGDGRFSDNIDLDFSQNINEDIIQVHGHRNAGDLPIINKNSVNLEGQIEYGGDLRVVTLNKNNLTINMEPHYIKNNYYIKGMLKMNEPELEFNKVAELEYQVKNDLSNISAIVETLRQHPMIKETVDNDNPHISSFNFTRNAFHDLHGKKIDHFNEDIVSHSRGLFINTQTNKIVARGFEKFFNLNEVETTKLENLDNNYAFPVTLYKKENGFLGLIGYDEESDELVFTSKSRADGIFPDYFKNIALSKINENDLNKLKRYAQKYNANFIFEVIDINNDPHIVKYDENTLVLLAIVKRTLEYQDVKYESLDKFAKEFQGFNCKERAMTFKDQKSLTGFIENMNRSNKIKHEGFVVEDQNGKKFKIKSPYYVAWKLLRSNVTTYFNNHFKLVNIIEELKGKEKKTKKMISLIKESEEDLVRIKKSTLERIKGKLKHHNILNETLTQDIISCCERFVNNPKRNFSLKDFYEEKNKYIETSKQNEVNVKKFKM